MAEVCHLLPKTDRFLSNTTFSSDDIQKIIENLDSGKAHGHDRISIRILEICGSSICKSLEIIFKSCSEKGFFSTGMEKSKCSSS